jgi:ribosomal protein S12 methylthiotransferase accessory factor
MELAPPLSQRLLRQATGVRCGLTLPASPAAAGMADLPGFHNWAVPIDVSQPWLSACGALARTAPEAEAGAIAETIERYCAGIARFAALSQAELPAGARCLPHRAFALYAEAQEHAAGFPWPSARWREGLYAEVFALADNRPCWVPQELVGMGPRRGDAVLPSTSSGLAAHTDPWLALLRAAQELLERDAFAVTWVNSLGGREIPLGDNYEAPVRSRGGQVLAFDLTQAWNPHAVVAVCGRLPQRGHPRIALGVACRQTRAQAIEKAYLEWVQGIMYAGQGAYGLLRSDFAKGGEHPETFEEHAVHYSLHPERWDNVPLLRHRFPSSATGAEGAETRSPAVALNDLRRMLANLGIELFYRDLTTPDVRAAGLHVVRVLSPALSLLHGDERYPFLGGRTRDVGWRYPDLVAPSNGLNPFPHPLG